MKSFNVIINDFNRDTFEPYDVMPYLVDEYNKAEVKPSSFHEFKDFVKQIALYQWWGRCEYEIILVDWPNQKVSEKWDVYKQVMMNIDTIVGILIENIYGNTKSPSNQ